MFSQCGSQGGHPADRPDGRRAIGPGPGQAAAPLDVESVTATQAGCLALAGLLDIPGHAGRPAIHQPPITSPPELSRKQHNIPGEVPALQALKP